MSLNSIATKILNTYGGKETEHNWEKIDTLFKEYIGELPKSNVDNIMLSIRRFRQVLQEVVSTILETNSR